MTTSNELWANSYDAWTKTVSTQIYSNIIARMIGDIVCCGLTPTDQQVANIIQVAATSAELWESAVNK